MPNQVYVAAVTTQAATETLPALEIKRSSAVDQVAEALSEMILRGDLPPGTPLRETQLARSVGISRNTVRDAVRVLARQGLVNHTMNRGAVVARLSERDVVDVFRVRRALEVQAIEASAQASPEQLAGLEDAVRAMRRAAEDGEWHRIIEADCLFHRRLVGILGSPRLNRFFDTIQGEFRICLSIVDRDNDDGENLVAEHHELYELIAAGRRQECIDMLAEHLGDCETLLCGLAREWDGEAATEKEEGE